MMYKKILSIIGFIFTLIISQPVYAMCNLSVDRLLQKNEYFNTRMVKVPSKNNDNSIAYGHIDDGRMVVNLSFNTADPIADNTTRSSYVKKLDEFGNFMVDKAKSQGRWAEKFIHPQDPVTSVVIEEISIDTVGESLAGHMESRFTPTCILTVDFVGPSSKNLQTRWVTMVQEISNLRLNNGGLVDPIIWEPEDNSPKGWSAVFSGLGVPLFVIFCIAFLLGKFKDLDVPSVYTKTVLGVSGVLIVGTLLYQNQNFINGFSSNFNEIRYLDNLLLLIMIGCLNFMGLISHQSALTRIGLISSCVGGFALIVSSYLGWTPYNVVGYFVGVTLMLTGGLGYLAWSKSMPNNQKTK